MKWRPKIRFSMRTLFILVTVLCVLLVPLSVKLYKARQQRLAVAWVLASGGTVLYDYQWAVDPDIDSGEPMDNLLLRTILGKDLFDDVIYVYIEDPRVPDISRLTHLPSLKYLNLNDPQLADLSPLSSLKHLESFEISFSSKKSFTAKNIAELSKLKSLRSVNISGQSIDDLTLIQKLNPVRQILLIDTQVTDLAPLIHLKQLEFLVIIESKVTDFSPLSDLTNLETLSLDDPNLTDLTPLSKLIKLQDLTLVTPKVNDLTPLESLVNLENIRLNNMDVNESQINSLQKALPNCYVRKR